MKLNKSILILLLCLLSLVLSDCSTMAKQRIKEKKRHKQNEKLVDERKEEETKQYEDAVKQHYKNQTRKTRKRMKSSARKSRRLNENKKEFFLKRWFTRKGKRKKRNDLK